MLSCGWAAPKYPSSAFRFLNVLQLALQQIKYPFKFTPKRFQPHVNCGQRTLRVNRIQGANGKSYVNRYTATIIRGRIVHTFQSRVRWARPPPGVIVRGCADAGAGPDPGVPPNNEDMISPNGLTFPERGGGISKYSVANSFNTYDPAFNRPYESTSLVTYQADFGVSEDTTARLVCPAETYPGLSCDSILRTCGTLYGSHRKLRKVQ
jgi:hypothetical protein